MRSNFAKARVAEGAQPSSLQVRVAEGAQPPMSRRDVRACGRLAKGVAAGCRIKTPA